tara:strand:+ start:809 stop:994 length:186 start_codon:yes stop_codon:yes gene_type:complete
LKNIQDILIDHKLNFLGFSLTKPVKSLFSNYFPDDITQTNLQNWIIFEEQHPNTFAGMYQF